MFALLDSLVGSACYNALAGLALVLMAWIGWRQFRDRERRRYYRQRERARREYWGWD